MTAVARPDLDLTRLRHAVERIDLDGTFRDLGRLRAAVEGDIARLDLPDLSTLDLSRIDPRHMDLPDLDRVFGRRRAVTPSGSLLVGALALAGGLALGGLVAFFLNPSKGAKRRRQARRRLVRVKRRVLGS